MFDFVLIQLISVISKTGSVRFIFNMAAPCQPLRQQSVTFFDEFLITKWEGFGRKRPVFEFQDVKRSPITGPVWPREFQEV